MELALAIAVIVGSHVAIARTGLKPRLSRWLGAGGYLAAHSLLSLALLGWVIAALLRTPRVVLWETPPWAHGFALALVAAAFALLGAGAATPNALSISFRKGFDPAKPGLIHWVRHPIIWAFGLWGLAHMPANGDAAALALFGGTALFSLIGALAVERRLRKQMGEAAWAAAAPRSETPARLPAGAILGGLLGLAAFIVLLRLHPILFGVDPLAPFMAY